jgi:propionaldehyde dehydrogenase
VNNLKNNNFDANNIENIVIKVLQRLSSENNADNHSYANLISYAGNLHDAGKASPLFQDKHPFQGKHPSVDERNILADIPIGERGIFPDIPTAIEQAKRVQKKVAALSMAEREKIIARIREKTIAEAQALGELAVAETGMGNAAHKKLKHELLARKTPGTEDIQTTAWSGDNGLTLVERGPFGVIGAVTPSTNPSETVICNIIGMLAGGNAVVFNPHPGAVQVSNRAVQLINEAAYEAAGLENIAVSTVSPTIDSGNVLFAHPDIALLSVTGGPGVVTAALKSGKRAIGAGAGNPPVLVDETADIKQAAKNIVDGATFDHNLPCIAEKEIIAVSKIIDELEFYLRQNDCYLLNEKEVALLSEAVFTKSNGKKALNRYCVGRSAPALLQKIGVTGVDESIRCLIFRGNRDHILIRAELMMPILGIVETADISEAIEISVALEHGNRHSAHMHSKNVDNLTRFARAADTAIFVKNAPSYAAIGFGGEGYCTFTIASRTGEGLTSAQTFTKSRRCVLGESFCIR